MAFQKTMALRHYFGGGWATDFGPNADVSPDQAGKVVIPFLTEAQDLVYELDGGPHKIGGTSKVNSASVAGGAGVQGLYDYWRQGTGGAATRRRILHAGTVCLADTDDGSFVTSLATGLTSGSVPCYATFNDLLIYSSDSSVDVPRSWDQTTSQNLAGSPPRFSFSCFHKNRHWAAGNYAAPSRLYYSANVNPEDWTGVGSGSIDIDLSDGDMITAIASHKNELWVFKGPNKGSIHRITGSSPTGSDAFARTTFISGLGAAWQSSIFRFSDDLGFVSQYGSVHSLAATAAYGDFLESALSRPINRGGIRDRLNYNRLRNIWAATDSISGLVFITMSVNSNTTNNVVLVMDYRNAPNAIRWSRVPAYALASLASFVDTNGIRRVLGGGNDGYVRRLNVLDRSIDGSTSLSYQATTPFLSYGEPMLMKTIGAAAIGLAPRGNYNATFSWKRDNNAAQSTTISQGGADVLGGASANQFTLNTSTLGGSLFVDRFAELEDGGEFRSVQYEVTNSGNFEDVELHSITAVVSPGALSTENA